MRDPRSVANFIIDTRRFLGGQTTALELQKILYFCHASYLVGRKAPLVAGDFEAWEYGPVHPIVYRAFKSYGKAPITRRAKATNLLTGAEILLSRPEKPVQRHIVATVSSLFDLTAGQLVEMTHAPGAPWDVVWREKDSKGAIISDRTIREHYNNHRLRLRAVEASDAGVEFRDVPPYDD